MDIHRQTLLVATALGARIQYRYPSLAQGEWLESHAVSLGHSGDTCVQRIHPDDDTPTLRKRINARVDP